MIWSNVAVMRENCSAQPSLLSLGALTPSLGRQVLATGKQGQCARRHRQGRKCDQSREHRACQHWLGLSSSLYDIVDNSSYSAARTRQRLDPRRNPSSGQPEGKEFFATNAIGNVVFPCAERAIRAMHGEFRALMSCSLFRLFAAHWRTYRAVRECYRSDHDRTGHCRNPR